jgi:hypothetical protein
MLDIRGGGLNSEVARRRVSLAVPPWQPETE